MGAQLREWLAVSLNLLFRYVSFLSLKRALSQNIWQGFTIFIRVHFAGLNCVIVSGDALLACQIAFLLCSHGVALWVRL